MVLEKVSAALKSEPQIYLRKNKQLINSLLESTHKHTQDARDYIVLKEKVSAVVNEDIESEWSTDVDSLELFYELMIKMSPTERVDFNTFLRNFNQKKRFYTQEEYDNK